MRANSSFDGGATFTGMDLPLPPPRTQSGFDFGSDPGFAFDANGRLFYSYIIVFFSKGGSINGTEMAVSRSTRRRRRPGLRRTSHRRRGTASSTTSR